MVSQFKNVHMVPLLTKGTWQNPESVELKTLTGRCLVKSSCREELPDGVCKCFESVGVKVLCSLPEWIPKEKVKSHFFWPTQKSFVTLLSEFGSESHGEFIDRFNTSTFCKQDDRYVFVSCLAKCHHNFTDEAIEFVKSLKLFRVINSMTDKGDESSVSEVKYYINKGLEFPDGVNFPFPCLEADSSLEPLLAQLGAKKIDLQKLVILTLQAFQKRGFQSTNETSKFMDYFIKNFHLFQTERAIIDAVSKIPFLKSGSQRCKAADVFDPSDTLLKDLLIGDELLPETKKPLKSEQIRILKFLGLRTIDDITADIVVQVARTLDTWSKESHKNDLCQRKAESLMKLLDCKQTLLHGTCENGMTLAKCLRNLACIPVHCNRVPNYPECVQWFSERISLCKPEMAKEANIGLLVGATVPIVSCSSKKMNEEFGWKQPPAILDVISQLKIVQDSYSVDKRPDILPLIKAIYIHLSQRHREVWNYQQTKSKESLIWNGDSFVEPSRVIISNSHGDLDLMPYFCFLPPEFTSMQKLFTAFGCHLTQEHHILVDTLKLVKEFHTTVQDEQSVTRDRKIVCSILDKIARKVDNQEIYVKDIELLMMVQDTNSNTDVLQLCPISECVYDDDPTVYFESNETIYLVHEMVSKSTVEALGIKSITRKALLDAEEIGVEEWGQQEPLTTRIHALLRDGYTDGLSVPKELIQNADDAGATVVKFLYDERQNADCRQRVFSREMRAFQGPALWVFNDAQFTDEDLKNITKLNAATKQTDIRKIGKFGLGFCSVYNLTDLPSFLSGSKLVFFDPHEKHIHGVLRGRGTGLKYQLPNKTLVSRHKDQFRPYSGIFGCDIDKEDFESYTGTLFRLPLRTDQQAKESLICPVSYTKDEMTTLLRMFMETAGNCLLFTQNVQQLEIYHLPEKAHTVCEPKLLYKIQKDDIKLNKGIDYNSSESVLSRMPQVLARQTNFVEIHKSIIRQTRTDNAEELVGKFDDIEHSESSWITSWATGNKRSLDMYSKLSSEGAVPLSAVSVPCIEANDFKILELKHVPMGFYSEGHVFCFLPLPLKTKLPFHINGCFAVTSDRRQLATLTEDDKNSKGNTWNVALMEDSLVNAHLQLLQSLTKLDMTSHVDYKYYELWPTVCSDFALPFKIGFYKAIVDHDIKVFRGNGTWLSFREAVFLHPDVCSSFFGELAFEILTRFPPRNTKILIEMPDFIIENILKSNKDKENSILSAQISEEEFFITFLNTLNTDYFWTNRLHERNRLILASIKCKSRKVEQKMQTLKCIPTEPNNALSRACDLIHPKASIASLFCEQEAVFPIATEDFRKDSILTKLVRLGMNDNTLTNKCLLERCKSISTMAESCNSCAKERGDNLVRYLTREHVLNELEKDKNTLQQIAEEYILPVLSKPKQWAFSWRADSDAPEVRSYKGQTKCTKHQNEVMFLQLGKPNCLFRLDTKEYVGLIGVLVDENYTLTYNESVKRSRLLKLLGVKSLESISVRILVKQLKQVVEEYSDKSKQFTDISKIHDKIFFHLEKKLKLSEIIDEDKEALESLKGSPFVLMADELVRAQNVAFNVKAEYKPYLNRLPEVDKLNKQSVYTLLGVPENFNLETIIEVLRIVRYNEKVLHNLETVNNLLINLDEVMQRTGISYEDMTEYHDDIIAPDTHGKLWPTYQLVVENADFSTSPSMKILHMSIAPLLAQTIGVKIKRLQCIENIRVGIPFGQREKLVTRIKGLLKAYPCDSSIMKELLQNADDAGATEIHFVKDYRTHSKTKIFDTTCEVLQGPSLCVYNNSFFTEKDIEGIHNLGLGSKNDDPTKTGQYGVGFNAVYHLTDTPSFVTIGPNEEHDSLMFILDPLCKHVPLANLSEPGMMCNIKEVSADFPDHLIGFSIDDLIHGDVGTVFRLPLRRVSSEISNEEISIEKMNELLLAFQTDMFECVLFLKNINCIKISNITSGTLEEEYTVKVELTDGAKRERDSFNETVNKIIRQNKNSRENYLEIQPREAIYPMSVADNRKCCKHWMIIQRFGKDGHIDQSDEIKENLKNGDIGLFPLGGVAIPLNSSLVSIVSNNTTPCLSHHTNKDSETTKRDMNSSNACSDAVQSNKTFSGKLFCFLPIPVITGLPVHVNGHFALDHEARRDLWKDGYRHRWNICLVNNVIIQAWISGLIHLRNLITPLIKSSKKWQTINNVLFNFHSNFPVQNCTEEFWDQMAKQFYKYIVKEHIAVFSCILDEKNKKRTTESMPERFCVSWTTVNASPEGIFDGIFNTVNEEMAEMKWVKQKDIDVIVDLLKAFGMKLLQTPNTIRRSMVKAGIEGVLTSAPSEVITYMKTPDSSGKTVQAFIPVGSPISETIYISTENLYLLLKYIMRKGDFHTQMDGLPVWLTADGIVRVCTNESQIFMSRYSQLLPKSAHLFIHEDVMLAFLDPKMSKSKILKEFQFGDFVRLLPESMEPDVYCSGFPINLKKDEEEIAAETTKVISERWFTILYNFMCECSSQASDHNVAHFKTDSKIDTDMLISNIKMLGNWSFLPCKQNSGNHSLIPMCETKHVLFLSVFDKLEGIGKSLEIFGLPQLYGNAFSKCRQETDVRRSMENIVASVKRPYDLLQCLVHHKSVLETNSTKTEQDGIQILSFFGRNIKVLEKCAERDEVVTLLRQLPFYITQQGTMKDISGTEEIMVLPKGMPFGGLQTWADTCNIILLQENDSLEPLYDFLGLQRADTEFVYGHKILPTFNAIPNTYWMQHVEYLRDHIGHRVIITEKHKKILIELKKIAFINVDGVMKRANELFDPSITLFKHMVESCDCVPGRLLTPEWNPFLVKLDLICDVTDEMVVNFARKIESESADRFEKVCTKSEVLISRFCKNGGSEWKTSTLSQIRTVRFIKPFYTSKENTDVYQQFSERGKLICFQDAVSSDHSNLCWTTVNLLSCTACDQFDKNVKTVLGIHEQPPLDQIVVHCENVCNSFKQNLCKNSVTELFVKNQMQTFYELFGKCTSLSEPVISRLRAKPFIHLPEEREMVKVSDVVIDLPLSLEIKPYLYRAPTYYGKYFDLFTSIGCKSKVMFCHYATVLHNIKNVCNDQVMSPPERAVVKSAYNGLLNLNAEKDENIQEVRTLFLPTQKMTLKSSKEIIVSNEVLLEIRLKGKLELDFCADRPFLDNKNISLEEVCSRWPEHIKPIFLTDVIEEEVCLEQSEGRGITNSSRVSKIKTFLHSSELSTALCRLIRHQSPDGTPRTHFDGERTEHEISVNLQNITVVEFPGLRTVLKYRGNIVRGSEKEIKHYIRKDNCNNISFYFNDGSRTQKINIPKILHGMISLLRMCASSLNADSLVHVTLLIQSLETPQEIPVILDSLHIKQYGSPNASQIDYFPKPGTYVEARFIPFLVQSINPFKEYEYDHVAMELEDSVLERVDDGEDSPVFIYVKILEEVATATDGTGEHNDLSRRYIVETGNKHIPSEQVPIYRLYRFVRKDTGSCTEIEIYSRERSENPIPIDEQCQRIREQLKQAWKLPEIDRKRVIKRILLQWHPDKNRGNEEYCTEVFKYIQVILGRLENGEILVDDIKEEMSRGKSKFSGSSSTFYENVFKRARTYARAYYDNFESYNKSERTGSYAHFSAPATKRPDHDEAQRWFRQAKADYLTAMEMFPEAHTISAFNWVCYICHQACEKALKSTHYSRDANNVPGGIELPTLALTPEMREQVTLLERRLGEHGRLRYPDPMSRPMIPSDMFSQEDAELSLKVARNILELAEELIQ